MEELVSKLGKELGKKLEEVEQKLNTLESKDYSSIYNQIIAFINEYEKQNTFNTMLFQSFYDEIDNSRLLDATEYQKMINAISELMALNDSGLFDTNISMIREQLNQMILQCKRASNEILGKVKNTGYDKRTLKNEIIRLKEVASALENIELGNIISSDNLEVLYNFIKGDCESLTNEEKISIVRHLYTQNVMLMDSKVKRASLREEVKKKQEVVPQSTLQPEQHKEIPTEELKKPLNFEEWLKTKVSEQYYELYLKGYELINGEVNSSIMTDVVAKIMEKGNKNAPLEERLALYKALSDYNSQKYLLIMDIKNNIMGMLFENYKNDSLNEDLFVELELILEEYDKIVKEEQKKQQESQFDYEKLLKDLNKNEELSFLGEVEDLVHKVSIKSENDKSFKVTAQQFVEKLLSKKADYVESLKIYYDSKDAESLSLTDDIYKELVASFVELQKVYEEYTYSNPVEAKGLEDLSKEFYSGVDKFCNILILPSSTSSIVSDAEEDIEKDSRIVQKGKGYTQALDKLRLMVSTDYIAESYKEGNHRIQTDNYSDEFLKEFRVRSEKNGDVRIFYSQFSTNLGSIVANDSKHRLGVLFIHEIAYGDTDGLLKKEINEESLYRCYKNREEIRKILALFNTKWDTLSEEDKIRVQAEIDAYIQKSNKQLGHFIMKMNETVAKEGVLS